MDKNRIKYKNNFLNFFQEKNNIIQKVKFFRISKQKSFLLIELLIMTLKLKLVLSQSLNKKRSIMLLSSSIKLKIDNSGWQNVYSNRTYEYCEPIIAPDEIYINGENQSEIKDKYNLEKNESEITLIWYNPLIYANCMFRDCTSITEIDLSNFDDSQLIRMQYMFNNCRSLKKIEISKVKANKVSDAGNLFQSCSQLESINLTNFCPLSNVQLHYMFENCNSLISINFPNFKPDKAEKIDSIFRHCNNLIYINFENAIINKEIKSVLNITINSNHIICTHSPNLISIIKDISAVLNCTNNYCINQIEDDDCFSSNYKYHYNNIFYENCPNGTYNDSFECIDCNEKCSLCSKESSQQNLCLLCNISNKYYEKYNNTDSHNPLFKDCFKSPFYLDSSDLLYKQCYYSCASCDKKGNEENHYCIECNNEYKFQLKLGNYSNCYSECPNYYYIEKNNDNNIYKCTLKLECPNKYNKLISDLGKCIDKCENENNYKYEYRNKCFSNCPNGTMKNNNTLKNNIKYFCKLVCDEKEPFEIIKEQKCVKYCSIEELNNNLCILNFKSENHEDILIKNFEVFFTSENYNTSKIDQGEEEIYKEEAFTITFTSSENQKNNINNNMTNINLGQCEIEIRQFYNL